MRAGKVTEHPALDRIRYFIIIIVAFVVIIIFIFFLSWWRRRRQNQYAMNMPRIQTDDATPHQGDRTYNLKGK